MQEMADLRKVIDKQTLSITMLERDVQLKAQTINEKEQVFKELELKHEEVQAKAATTESATEFLAKQLDELTV